MAIDALPETKNASQPSRLEQLADPPQSRRWRRGLLAFALITIFASVAALLVGAMSSQELGPRLTHTITRGDLRVTVTEQGTLESAENTEVKCKVRGQNTVIWVIESGAVVKPGDELIRLETLFIQEQIDERTKYAHWSRSAAEHSKARVAAAELAVSEYEQGRYVSALMTAEKDVVIAESRRGGAMNILRHAEQMAESGYASELDVEEKEFEVAQAELDVKLNRTRLDVLKRFTKNEQLETLRGNLVATKATHEANVERAMADASRRDRAVEEFEYCIIKAERGGLVIHPSLAQWETAPIAEGATVHKDQLLLLMPDLSQMQVKVGIHESIIDRMKEGLSARVSLSGMTLDGSVSSVASVTKPAGWWTGNEVKYDTLIKLPSDNGLRPGMSAEVEVLIAEYEDVLTIPVAAIVETDDGDSCWVKTPQGTQPRPLVLGDSNDVFTIVQKGLKEGDQVVLNPPIVPQARTAKRAREESKETSPEAGQSEHSDS